MVAAGHAINPSLYPKLHYDTARDFAPVTLIGDGVAIFFSTAAVARPHVLSGRIKGLAVTTPRRSVALPDVPTIAEAGLPGYAASGWYGFIVPVKTPRAAIERLNSAVQSALRPADIREKLASIGVEVAEATTAQFGELITKDMAKWEKVVKPLKISPE